MPAHEKERKEGLRKLEGADLEADLKEKLATEGEKTEQGGKFEICLVEESRSQKKEEQELSV